MRKILSAILSAALICTAVFAITAFADSNTITADDGTVIIDYADSSAHAISFDTIYKNNKRMNNPDGKASMWIDDNTENRTIDGSDGSFKTIGIRGWVGFDGQEVDQLGYMIDSSAPVFGDWKQDTEDTVKLDENGGSTATRFSISVPVSDLEGLHKISAVAKLMDGTVVLLDSLEPNRHNTVANMTFYFQAPGATPEPTAEPTPEPTATPEPTEEPVPTESENEQQSSGCGSVIGGSACCVLVLAAAIFLRREKI